MRPLRAVILALAPSAAVAEGLALSPTERAAFGAEIRALLLDEPEIVAQALAPPDLYAESIDADLDLLAQKSDQLFTVSGAIILGKTGEVAFVVFGDPDPNLTGRLTAFAIAHDIRIALRDPATHTSLMNDLDLDTIPSYVFPTLMVRGDVPDIVLERYLSR